MDKIAFENRMREIDKRYSEYFAQALLAFEFDKNFACSKTDECPDIHLNYEGISHGVEVTRFICSYYKTLKHYAKAWANQGLSIEQIVKTLPEELKNAVGLNHDCKIVPLKSLGENNSTTKTKRKLAEILDTKLDRLQKYKQFDKNSLYIFATELGKNFTPLQMLSAFINQSKIKSYELKFDNIMVFTYDKLVVFDMNRYDKVYSELEIDEQIVEKCDKFARHKIKNPNVALKHFIQQTQQEQISHEKE